MKRTHFSPFLWKLLRKPFLILRILYLVRTGTLPYFLLSYEWWTTARLSSSFSLPVLQRCGMVCQSRDGCAFITGFEGRASEWITGMLMQVREVGGAWHQLQEVLIKITSFFLAKTVNCYIWSPFQLAALLCCPVWVQFELSPPPSRYLVLGNLRKW